jgi:DNA-binding response OmpR family regulator
VRERILATATSVQFVAEEADLDRIVSQASFPLQSDLSLDSMRVLIAEDEKKVSNHIRNALRQQGFAVDEAHRGDEALELACATPYDAIVLDIMMPGRDGLSVLRILRERQIVTPIILLTARGEVSERVEGLMVGADDYLAKPFAMDELIARIHALTRRSSGQGLTILKVHDLIMNLVTREVLRGGRPIELPMREFALLEYLMQMPDRVLSRTQIIEHVWDYHFDTGTNVVDVYIQRLRRKIDGEGDPKMLHTIRGVGYALRVPR